MEYTCQHCGANLDDGDIFEQFLLECKDEKIALETAKLFGWKETNKIHFKKVLVVKNDVTTYDTCPECHKIDPLPVKIKKQSI